MPVTFKIAITKAIIAHCKNCGTGNEANRVENNCAIAFALGNIFPKVYVTNHSIFPYGIDGTKEQGNEANRVENNCAIAFALGKHFSNSVCYQSLHFPVWH